MDYKKAIDDKKSELSDLQKRMDADADLVNLKEYSLRDAKGNKVPNSISITLNDPAVFAANVESSLGSAVEQVAVETEDKKLDTAYIEDLVRASLASADQRLIKRGEFPFNPYIDQSMCRRGGGAARCLFQMVDGVLVPDIVPWDRRYVYYEMGEDGLAFGANEKSVSKGDIESQAWAKKVGFTISGKGAVVLDVWDTEHNEIWVNGKQQFEQPHSYGFTPVVVQIVPMGSMLADKDSMKYQGESIFFLIRDLIPELNRLVSIIQNLNIKAYDNALKLASQEGKGAKVPSYDAITAPGAVIPIDIGGGIEPLTYGALKQQAWLLHLMIETRIQRGSLSNFEYGTFTQPMSAVALIQIGAGRDQVFLPRLGARGLLKQQLAFMLIDQIMQTGETSVDIGARGHKRTFDVRKLEGEYDINFQYFIKSPTIDIARVQTAGATVGAGLVSKRTARRDIIQLQDPDEEERLLDWEETEELIPTVKLRRKIKSLYDMADKGDDDARLDAELAEETLLAMIGQASQPEAKKETRPKELLSLLGEKGAAGPETSAQKAADLARTPVEEE